MNQTRSFLLFAWLAVAAWLVLQWYNPPAPPAATTAEPAAALPATADATADATAATATPAPLPAPAPAGASPLAPAATAASGNVADPIEIENDRVRLVVDLNGGRVTSAKLLQYRVEKKPGSPNVQLFDGTPGRYYVAESGLIAVDAAQKQQELAPRFRTADGRRQFKLPAGAAAISVPLEWTDPQTGIRVQRTLSLRRDSYVLETSDTVHNAGNRQLYPYSALVRVAPPAPPKHSFMTNPDSFSFVGSAWHSSEENFEKTPFSDYADEQPAAVQSADAWIGMLQHHFLAAWVPPGNEKQLLQTPVHNLPGGTRYEIRSIGFPGIAPGATLSRTSKLWVGPKLQSGLDQVAPTLKLGVDYGVLSFISQPLFWLLAKLHALIGNWGWAIIAIVLILKALLYWPSKKQYQSMAKMRAVMPRIEALKERYGEDKQALNVAMFELYKKEKVNPAAGCWPILIQMPIFLGLYWVLVETVELRHAPWIGWIQNLTAPDPYFVLPALNLAIMYVTQLLTPTPGMDPVQKKMMQFMPLVFGVMMAFFPAGLVLYWVTNGALSLLQQWHMLRKYGLKPGATPTVAR